MRFENRRGPKRKKNKRFVRCKAFFFFWFFFIIIFPLHFKEGDF